MVTVKEPFLINPPKRLRRKTSSKRHMRLTHWRPPSAKALGGEGTRHRPVVYTRKGHWFTSLSSKIARPGAKLNRVRRRRPVRHNPFGAEGMLVGFNPRRSSMALFGRRHHRNRKRHHRNPRRHYRRNPIMGGMGGYLPLVLGGAAGAVMVRFIPKIIGTTSGSITDYGVRLATIIGGGYGIKRLGSQRAAEGWVVGSAAIFLTDLLAPTLTSLGLSGMAAFPPMGTPAMAGFGAFPGQYSDNLQAIA